MQTQLKHLSQTLLTAIGLGLLAFSLALNYYHPRNEGISTSSREAATVTTASAIDTKN